MAGAILDVTMDASAVGRELEQLIERLGSLRTPLNDIAEYLHISTDNRARRQIAPDGSPWAPLSARTLAKKKGKKILRESGALLDTLRHQVTDDSLDFGTDKPYGAIHQDGGKIEHAARSQQVYFKEKGGVVGNRFVKKSKSNFAQWVTHGARTVEMPARPYLGLSTEDETRILEIVSDYLTG
ncbi:TPA: phage virion morphogenesis protein [Pseudomonas putida]|uniref:phage virion morphogenesis protein n=1 Tax=Pseudomonas sp. TaxID=306 RepID=UPI00264746E4|nr:phage virion morphogenesis protein [Pseudomonas sp.]MDN5520212.1 phage virion morphogenesis protein [Pseudomonas sp.]MDN5532003.1 phage virion morphogenesis protein [Pseudomonas sp.]